MTEFKFVNEVYSYKNTSYKEMIPSRWKHFFDEMEEELTEIFDKLKEIKKTIYPPITKVFRAFYLTFPNDIKVVILGQDPYHNGNAVGLAFSVEEKILNPSLKNIILELEGCGYKCKSNKGDLTNWAEQGVFLINTGITVEASDAGSHTSLWSSFSATLIN